MCPENVITKVISFPPSSPCRHYNSKEMEIYDILALSVHSVIVCGTAYTIKMGNERRR
jgi:hypothetical protein